MRIDKRFRNSLNFRDIGGLECNDGKVVKKNLFYRGAALNFYSDDELKEFEKLNIKTIMDIRSGFEIDSYPDPIVKGCRYIEHSGLEVKGAGDIDWSPEGMMKIGKDADDQLNQIKGYYRLIAFDNEAFRLMINEIKNNNLPIYVHCAVGKDRTGFAYVVIEMLLNVKKEEMKRDYLLSNLYREEFIQKSLDSVSDIAKNNPEINTLIRMLDGVIEDIFNVVIEAIESKYSTYDEYIMKEYGLNEGNLFDIRNRYTN